MSKQIQLVAADGLRLETTENFNLGPRLPNREYRDRDWLEPGEVEAMVQAVRSYAARHPRAKRFAHRDEAIILLTWRHGLRISEALELKWQSINLTTGHVMVLRRKGSIDGRHPMERDEVHLLKKLRAEYPGLSNTFSVISKPFRRLLLAEHQVPLLRGLPVLGDLHDDGGHQP